jgi:hypothetical protein
MSFSRSTAIPGVIRELRNEWADARKKVWNMLNALRTSRTLGEASEIEKELIDASKLFSPTATEADTFPARVFWELLSAASAGAMTAQLSGGNAVIGAAWGLGVSLAQAQGPAAACG